MKSILAIAAMILLAGCKKETVSKPAPVIEIITPTANQHYVMGETIHITGAISSTVPLTEVAVHMTDLGTKIEFFHNHFSGGDQLVYSYDSFYPIPDNTRSSFKVEVEATDKDGTATSKEITIMVN
jgi:hypothetical protein